MSRKERLEKWANDLTPEQQREALVACVSRMVESEDLRFWGDSLAPYWESCGEPLVEGQDCFPDDNDE